MQAYYLKIRAEGYPKKFFKGREKNGMAYCKHLQNIINENLFLIMLVDIFYH